MISREEMIKADGKYVNIDYKNGKKLKNVYVIEYLDDIESIEILD